MAIPSLTMIEHKGDIYLNSRELCHILSLATEHIENPSITTFADELINGIMLSEEDYRTKSKTKNKSQ